MLKSQLISLLKLHPKDLPVKIWTFDPELLWHETEAFEVESDCVYSLDLDRMVDILSLDISVVSYTKQTIGSLIKELNKEKLDVDVRLLEFDDHCEEMYQFNQVSDFSVTVNQEYILIKGKNFI
jgi:hypothetical protein